MLAGEHLEEYVRAIYGPNSLPPRKTEKLQALDPSTTLGGVTVRESCAMVRQAKMLIHGSTSKGES